MISNLEFLRGELTKVQKTLNNTKAGDYKRYATLYQTYISLTNTINQIEAIQKQMAEEEKRKQEEARLRKEAEEELKKEANKVEE